MKTGCTNLIGLLYAFILRNGKIFYQGRLEGENGMTTKIALDFERGGTVTATLLTKEAPRTCAAVLDALPFEHETKHAMWAGEEIFFDGFPVKEQLTYENETNTITDPILAVVSNAASKSFRNKLEVSFCIFYGESRPRKGVDETVDANVFATVDDAEATAAICKRFRITGAEKLTIRAVD
jgi:hypothetical protein